MYLVELETFIACSVGEPEFIGFVTVATSVYVVPSVEPNTNNVLGDLVHVPSTSPAI